MTLIWRKLPCVDPFSEIRENLTNDHRLFNKLFKELTVVIIKLFKELKIFSKWVSSISSVAFVCFVYTVG